MNKLWLIAALLISGLAYSVEPIQPANTVLGCGASPCAPSGLTQSQIGAILGNLTYGAAPFPVLVSPGITYAPGDTITLTGGTSTIAAQIRVGQTQAVSAAVNAGGSGGTNGACTVAATTGTGTQAQFTGTVSGNALTGPLTVAVAGSYSSNPTTLSAVPVTGCSLAGATVSMVMGVLSTTVQTSGTYTTTPPNPASQGSTTGSGSGATFTVTWGTNGPNVPGTPLTLTQFGAKCDGVTDDTAAITKWALSAQPYTTLAMEAGVVCIFDPSNGGTATYGMNFQNLSHFVINGNGATIRAKAASSTTGNSFLMRFKTSTDIVIMDLILDGNVANRTGTPSYGGDNIFIEDGSARILFDHVRSINSTKDGWDVNPDGSPTTQATYPTDITWRDCDGVGNYRQGISLIGSVRATITGGNYSSITGEAPSSGIDIEPDSTIVYANSYTRIQNVDTSFNAGPGINIAGHPTSVTATSASPAVFTGMTVSNGTQLVLGGTTAPIGFTKGVTYFVVATSGNTFELAATLGGTAINSSSTGTAVTVQSYTNHVLIKNWSAQSNATYAISINSVKDLEIDGAFISNVSATPPSSQGIIDLTNDPGLSDISLRNLHFDNITAAAGNLIYTSSGITDRIFIDGVHAEGVSTSLIGVVGTATVLNVDAINDTYANAAINVGANSVVRNVSLDTLSGYDLYCSSANVELDNWTVKDWANSSRAFYIDSGCTGFIANGVTALQSTSIPGPVWTFTVPPKQITNFVAHSAGTDYVPVAISGCGTAGTIRLNGLSGTFLVGTGAGTCTFTFTINGSTGLIAPTGWIANVYDVTAKLACVPNGAIASTTAGVALCNASVTTGDLVTFNLVPF